MGPATGPCRGIGGGYPPAARASLLWLRQEVLTPRLLVAMLLIMSSIAMIALTR